MEIVNIQLPYDLAVLLLGIYPKEMKTCLHKNCTQMYTAFVHLAAIAAQKCKEHKCPSTDKWVSNTWYSYSMKYYSVIKRNEPLIYATNMDKLWKSYTKRTKLPMTPKPHGSELHGSTYTCSFLAVNTSHTTLQSMVGWNQGCRIVDTEGWVQIILRLTPFTHCSKVNWCHIRPYTV